MGRKISRFSKMLIFFFFVQDATASGPSEESVEKKWDVKKWNLESRVVLSREILASQKCEIRERDGEVDPELSWSEVLPK
jgi:hypothetical protein